MSRDMSALFSNRQIEVCALNPLLFIHSGRLETLRINPHRHFLSAKFIRYRGEISFSVFPDRPALTVSVKIDEHASRISQNEIIARCFAVNINSQWKGRRRFGHKNESTAYYKYKRHNGTSQ